jgi:dihydroneopterin aldolase
MEAGSCRSEARHSPLKDVVVIKLGGSHALEPHLAEWLNAIAAEAGEVVVAPGGGLFADAVRAAQAVMGFDEAAAHDMALMAMSQFGRALQGLDPRFRVAGSIASIRRALRERAVPVWSPDSMARAAKLPATWDLTSDSLAAWLARAIGARRLVLIKHGQFPAEGVAIGELVEDGVVDPLFPHYVGHRGLTVSIAGPGDAPRLGNALRGRAFPEILGTNEFTRSLDPAAE